MVPYNLGCPNCKSTRAAAYPILILISPYKIEVSIFSCNIQR